MELQGHALNDCFPSFFSLCFTLLVLVAFSRTVRVFQSGCTMVTIPSWSLLIRHINRSVGFPVVALTPQCWEFQLSLIHWRLSGLKLLQTLPLLHG